MTWVWACWLLQLAWLSACLAFPYGPPYPVTAAWFQDRFSAAEWDDALGEFAKMGGDAVLQRAPPLRMRSRDDLASDPTFAWCRGPDEAMACFDQARDDLTRAGLKVAGFLTYENEEDYSQAILACPKFERRINSSRVYHVLALPTGPQSSPCNLSRGESVVVLLTSFAGLDPHRLLLESAERHKMAAYLGLPAAPFNFSSGTFMTSFMTPYLHFVERVVQEHKARYSNIPIKAGIRDSTVHVPAVRDKRGHVMKRRLVGASLYDTVKGYNSADECSLPQASSPDSAYVGLYTALGSPVRSVARQLVAVCTLNTRHDLLNATALDHVSGFEAVVRTRVDVVAVREGRGAGKAGYFWATQLDTPVGSADVILDRILHQQNPALPLNVSFSQAFTASVQEVFFELEAKQQELQQAGLHCPLWLVLEPFESLRDAPCLTPDLPPAPTSQLLQATTKARLDGGLTAAGGRVQKVAALAWDPYFRCEGAGGGDSLANAVLADMTRPVLANCSFHNRGNKSIVVIAFNNYGPYQVDYPDYNGRRHVEAVHGSYFETNYGDQHGLVPSLEYVQMSNLLYITKLNDSGYVVITDNSSYHDCVFTFDYTW